MPKIHWVRTITSGITFGATLLAAFLWFKADQFPPVAQALGLPPLNDGSAHWRLTSKNVLAEWPKGAACVELAITGPAACQLTVVLFDEAGYKMEIVSQPSKSSRQFLPDLAIPKQAIAGCNGGYFEPRTMQPSGLEIASGVRTGTYGSSGSSGGAIGMKSGKAFLVNERGFEVPADVSDLVQCGPLLIEEGKPIVIPEENVRLPRTFAFTDGEGHWAIGVADKASLSGLAAMLANPKIISAFKVRMALNLDGGPSTGLWWRDPQGKSSHIKEKWPVRNMLLVIPK